MLRKVLAKVFTLFTAALGVVAALAWDDVVKSIFQRYYPFPGTGIEVKFLYALTVTIIAVIVTSIFAGLTENDDDANSNNK